MIGLIGLKKGSEAKIFMEDPGNYKAKALIFDFDGVIVKSEPLHYKTFCEILEPLGIRIARHRWYKEFAGTGSRSIIARLLEENKIKIGAAELDALIEKRKNLFTKYVANGNLKPNPGLRKFLIKIKSKGIKTAIASGGHRSNIEQILSMLKLNTFFDVIVGGEEAQNRKPHPEIFLRAAAKLGVGTNKCVAIEDSIPGAIAARRAGMALVCFDSPSRKSLNSRCVKLITSYSEFPLGLLEVFG